MTEKTTEPETVAFIGMGSNMGDPQANLATALRALDALPGIRVAVRSSLYTTEPQGLKEQPFFVNCVAKLACSQEMTALELLDALLRLETDLGRTREGHRFGPRLIDLDLLLFGNEVMNTSRLQLPHPRMHERAFVLVPLHEVEPALRLPCGTKLEDLLQTIVYRHDGNMLWQHE